MSDPEIERLARKMARLFSAECEVVTVAYHLRPYAELLVEARDVIQNEATSCPWMGQPMVCLCPERESPCRYCKASSLLSKLEAL